nr:hypothetical protein [uncultured Methanoregula sp.]
MGEEGVIIFAMPFAIAICFREILLIPAIVKKSIFMSSGNPY